MSLVNRRTKAFRPRTRVSAVLALAVVAMITAPASMASAADYAPITGAGSSWSSNAVDQWRRNVQQYGMKVDFASTGSTDGRNQFKAGTVDYAVSETPYGLKDNGVVDTPPSRGYAYMPLVAGGTSFMYNLKAGGKAITNLRLSGEVVTKIFTGAITRWDDAAIKADNPGLALPKRQIVPVVRSDGSGSTAQFTLWMSKQHQKTWDSYCKKAGRSTPCGLTSNFPVVNGKGFVAQPNSQGVSGYVAQKANEGTITYVEYSYALKTGYPVAKVLNESGYYVEPTASNVAVGLLGAKINTDKGSSQYLTQNLDGVYNSKDNRTYPLSSYSYIIVPTQVQGIFTKDKGTTLAAFANYFLCEGQQQAEVLGYSPLPINLVQAGLDQVKKIPGAVTKTVDIKKCNNPTFSKSGKNTLAANAPQPDACDKKGVTQCSKGTGGAKADTPTTNKPADTATDAPGAGTDSTGGGTTDTSTDGGTTDPGTGAVVVGVSPGATTGNGTAGADIDGPVTCDADTGECTSVAAIPVEAPAAAGWGTMQSLITGVIVVVLLLIFGPPLVIAAARKGNR